jgi:hypothetical protein
LQTFREVSFPSVSGTHIEHNIRPVFLKKIVLHVFAFQEITDILKKVYVMSWKAKIK